MVVLTLQQGIRSTESEQCKEGWKRQLSSVYLNRFGSAGSCSALDLLAMPIQQQQESVITNLSSMRLLLIY
jgi:hypothetical protein